MHIWYSPANIGTSLSHLKLIEIERVVKRFNYKESKIKDCKK